ncbi:MAG: hypothetical protein V7678_02860, partial [Brevundimonas sp.]
TVRTWKALGAPGRAASVLAFGSPGLNLARAARELLEPEALTVMHAEPAPPRVPFDVTPETLAGLAATRPGAFDLILAGGGLDAGSLGRIRDDLVHAAALLAPRGVLALAVDTLGAPDAGGGVDAVLFPHLSWRGDLDETPRALLPAASWMLLFRSLDLDVHAAQGFGAQGVPANVLDRHAGRLEIYDRDELMTGRLHLIIRKREERA